VVEVAVNAEQAPLIAIGYWHDLRTIHEIVDGELVERGCASEWLADPRRLVEALGPVAPEPAVIRYLRAGLVHETWRGLSWCRFECGVSKSEMGCRDLTDGYWVWPEGLAHYVDRHGLPLPEEFLATVRRGALPRPSSLSQEIEKSFWNSWYARWCPAHPAALGTSFRTWQPPGGRK
jgi:hypothetical protein